MNRILLQFQCSYANCMLHHYQNVPKGLTCVIKIEIDHAFHTNLMNSIHLQPAVMCLAFQYKVDQGDVVDWSIELMHPSKCNLKIDTIFYEELVEFCKNIYVIFGKNTS